MRSLGTKSLILAMLSACILAVATGAAGASTGQYSLIQDDGLLLSSEQTTNTSLDEIKALGIDMVKVNVIWRNIAPDTLSTSKPALDLTDPANYNWAAYDRIVQGVEARGMTPWLLLSTPAPNWASGVSSASRQAGSYKPDPVTFGQFAQAAARHFPEIKYWSIMNEPNFSDWIAPQVGSSKVSLSAVLYRKMYIQAHAGLAAGGAGKDQIMFGELAPHALQPKKGNQSTQPVRFLRDFFCLDDKLKPLKGSAAKARECTGKYKKIEATGFAYHPYTTTAGPGAKPAYPDDAPINSLKRLYKVLDKAYSYKRLSKKKIPLWNTEFGYQSNPPDIYWTPIKKVPTYMNAAEYLSYRDSRVKSYAQYQLRDEPLGDSGNSQYAGFQSGLYFADGTIKPAPMGGYQFPLVVNKTRSANKVSIWGGMRLKNSSSTRLSLQVKSSSGSWSTVKSVTVKARGRYFTTTYAATGAAKKTYRLQLGELAGYDTKVTTRVDARSN